MGRTPKGKPLTLRPIRLDDDVWAECQRLGKKHGTINEGLRAKLISRRAPVFNVPPPTQTILDDTEVIRSTVDAHIKEHNRRVVFKRGPREKGDKTR